MENEPDNFGRKMKAGMLATLIGVNTSIILAITVSIDAGSITIGILILVLLMIAES